MGTKRVPCKACAGTGKMTARKAPPWPPKPLSDLSDAGVPRFELETRTCPHCKGDGWITVKK